MSIAHPAVSRHAGRLRYYPLAGRRDLEVHLVAPARWHEFGRTILADPPDDPGLTVHLLPILFPRAGPMRWYLHVFPGLRRLIRSIRPHVIHLWEEPWSLVALQAMMLKGNASLVMEVDQNILKRLPPPFEGIRANVLRRTDHVLSRSPEASHVVRAKGFRGSVTAIGYGIDQKTFRPLIPYGKRTPTHGGLSIGYVGRIVEEKGIDDALGAMVRARAPISLAVMGEGPYEAPLRQRIAELGLGDRVTFRPWGEPADVAQFIRTLDAVVLLTRTTRSVREQFGRVIAEAQGCGVPVIGSGSGAIPSVIGDGGWVVPERDPDALAKVLDMLATDPRALDLRRAAALRNVAARFTYDAVADALASAWIDAADRNTTSPPYGSPAIEGRSWARH